MSFDAARLYALLPEVHRARDAEQGRPLEALLAVVADQLAVLEENHEQLYDDQFVETCAPWVLPYLGDLVGVRGLPSSGSPRLTPRAEVANTIAYRRRKGTAAVLEQLAHDVTGWQARAVEFFQILATTQHMHHVRPRSRSQLSVRDASRLEELGGAFEHLVGAVDLAHNVDVRSVRSAAGRYNIPNVGIFLWRLRAEPLTGSPAVPEPATGATRRFRFHPLGIDAPLVNLPRTEEELAGIADPSAVPARISRRVLDRNLGGPQAADYLYPRSLRLDRPGSPLDEPEPFARASIVAADLSDWNRALPTRTQLTFFVDPVLGRMVASHDVVAPPRVFFHLASPAEVGGGEYERAASFEAPRRPASVLATPTAALATTLAGLAAEVDTVELVDSGRFKATGALGLPARPFLELRAANKRRPSIVLEQPLEIVGAADGALTLNGLLISGAGLRVTGNLRLLRLRHCTLVPGHALDPVTRAPLAPGAPSLVVESPGTEIELDHCVVGGLRVHEDASVRVSASVIDATAETGVAFAGLDGEGPGGILRIEHSTVLGKLHTTQLDLATGTIFASRLASGDTWSAPVRARRRQNGCVRFSFVPLDASVPRRFRCQPVSGGAGMGVWPAFESMRYGDAAYAQLAAGCPREIRRGAEDESEMGVFHDLFQPQREDHLRARLDEYLRFGLEVGIFYAK